MSVNDVTNDKPRAITEILTIEEWWQRRKEEPGALSALRALIDAQVQAMQDMEEANDGNRIQNRNTK